MPILLKSLQGVGYSLPATCKVNEKINEDSTLDIDIIENRYTFDAVGAITKMWTITNVGGANDHREFRIVMIDKTSIGQKEKLSIKARLVELDDLNCSRIYEVYNGSFTGQRYFDLVFKGTGYKYKLHSKVSSYKFENLGNHDTRLEIFKKGLEQYDLEFKYDTSTKTFNLYDKVQHEADNVKVQEDASKCYTYIRGYGGFDNQQTFNEASLQFEYTDPLAQVIGKREAPPIIDGRMTKENTLKKAMELAIMESRTLSISLDFVALRKKFPEALPKIGDVVRVIDELIGVNDLVRIVEITTEYDVYNNIIKQDVVLGDFRLQDRYMKAVNNAASYVKALKTNKSDPAKDAKAMQAELRAATKTTSDLLSKTEDLNKKLKEANSKNVTTANGTIVHDFAPKSNIRKIKSIGTIGDSIAKGSYAKTNFTQLLAKKIKAKQTNLAVSGATMSTTKDNSIYEQASKIKADLIIVQGTDDDWINNIDIGTARQCYVDDGKIKRKDTDKNENGKTLLDYVNAQVDACNELDVPVFDAYRYEQFRPYSPSFRKSSMPDGVHFNDKGHEVIMYELINNYYSFYG